MHRYAGRLRYMACCDYLRCGRFVSWNFIGVHQYEAYQFDNYWWALDSDRLRTCEPRSLVESYCANLFQFCMVVKIRSFSLKCWEICSHFRSHPVWQREQQFRMRSPGSSPEVGAKNDPKPVRKPVLVRAQRMPSARPDSVPTLLLACRERELLGIQRIHKLYDLEELTSPTRFAVVFLQLVSSTFLMPISHISYLVMPDPRDAFAKRGS